MTMSRKQNAALKPAIFECDVCFSEDQLERQVHFLKFPDRRALAGHLKEQYGEITKDAQGRDTGMIDAQLAWVDGIKRQYSGMVDSDGVPIPAWRAWLQCHGVKVVKKSKNQ